MFCYSRLASSVSRININSALGQSVKNKSMRMIGICVFIFGLCFLPLNVVRSIGVVVKSIIPVNVDLCCSCKQHIMHAIYWQESTAAWTPSSTFLAHVILSKHSEDLLR